MNLALQIFGYLLIAMAIVCCGFVIKNTIKENTKGVLKSIILVFCLSLPGFIFMNINHIMSLFNSQEALTILKNTLFGATIVFGISAMLAFILSVINYIKLLRDYSYYSTIGNFIQSRLLTFMVIFILLTLVCGFITLNLPVETSPVCPTCDVAVNNYFCPNCGWEATIDQIN